MIFTRTFMTNFNMFNNKIMLVWSACKLALAGNPPQPSFARSKSFIEKRPYCPELQWRPVTVQAHFSPKNVKELLINVKVIKKI